MPPKPWDTSGGGSSGGGSGGITWGGGSAKPAAKGSLLDTPKVKKAIRTIVASGNTKYAKELSNNLGLSKRDRQALVAITKMNTPDTSFVGRLQDDIKGTMEGLPVGLVKMGVGVVKEGVALPRLASDLVQGNEITGDQLIGAVPVVGQGYALAKGAITEEENPESPFSSGVGTSLRNTYERVIHPKEAAEQYSQRPFSTFMEDVGNVALVAAPAAKLARVAGLSKTATALEQVNRAGNAVADLPFLPVSAPARMANRALGAARAKAASSRVTQGVTEFVGADPQSHQVRQVLKGAQEEIAGRQNLIADTTIRKQFQKVLKDPVEQQAAWLVGEYGDAVRNLVKIREVNPELVGQIVDRPLRPGDPKSVPLSASFSREAIDRAMDAVSGADPELMGRIEQGLEVTRPIREARQADLAASGRLNPEQLGYGPLSEVVGRATEKAGRRLPQAVKLAARLRQRADAAKAELDALQSDAEFVGTPSVARPRSGVLGPSLHPAGDVRLARILGKAEQKWRTAETLAARAERVVANRQAKVASVAENAAQSVEAMPARLRSTGALNRLIESELVGYRNQLAAEGLETAARDIDVMMDDIATSLSDMEAAGINPDHFIHGSEVRTKDAVAPLDASLPRTQKRMLKRRKDRTAYDTSARGMARAEAAAARKIIGERTRNKILSLPGLTRRLGDPGTLDANGRLSSDWVAWDPNSPFEKVPNPAPGATLIPKHVFNQYRSYFKSGKFDRALQRTYDPVTRGFKLMVLPLSPAWQVGNMVTNAFMATLVAGVDPISLVVNSIDAVRIRRQTGEWAGGWRLSESGSSQETMDMIGGDRAAPGRINRAMSVAGRPGYALNSAIDNMYRSAVYLAKTKKGYSHEAALTTALRAMGDFTNMSAFERKFVRRVIPFYAWMRHMTQVAVRLPVEHPLRTAWILGVSNHFAEDQEAWISLLPGYNRSLLPVGDDSYINVNNYMPFSNPFQMLSPEGAARNLNPIIKTLVFNETPLVGVAPGINPLNGMPFTRPAGTGPDNAGRDAPASPSYVEQFRQLSPQVRLLDSLLGREDVARYDSGDPVLVRGPDGKMRKIPTPKDDVRTLLKWAGVNIQDKRQLKLFVDAIITRQMDRWKLANPTEDLTPDDASTSSGGIKWGG